jgi:hypothetical protein
MNLNGRYLEASGLAKPEFVSVSLCFAGKIKRRREFAT